MNKIYTYTSLASIEKCEWFEEIRKYQQIVDSSALRRGINHSSKGWKYAAFDIKQIISTILPSWTTAESKFQESVILAQYMRERIRAAQDDEERKWLVGCRRNISSILAGIILLEEAKVVPDDIDPNDKIMELFVESWNYLLEKDPEIQHFRNRMESFDTDSEVEKLISNTFGDFSERKIVLHGFYYFTPIQKRVLEIIANHGFEFIFLFHYDSRYPIANEVWTRLYSSANGFDDEESWIKSVNSGENAFGALLEGNTAQIGRNVKIIEYRSIVEFVNDMQRVRDEKSLIYSSVPKRANEILKDFFPEAYGERKLLSYPVGQFVYTLNKMWDEDDQEIILDADSLRQCFSSGWITIDDISSKEYMNDLEYILPFFEKCRTVDEWNDRLGFLEEIDTHVIEQFRSKLSIHPEADKRWQEVYNNPFNSFSMFAVPKERLNKVISFISRIIEMAGELFGSDDEIVLGDHIRKLERLLKQHANARHIYAEEKTIVDELFKRFRQTRNSRIKCFPADIAGALSLLMAGTFDEEDEQSVSPIDLVYPLYKVDAAGLSKRKIHICLADVRNLPGPEKEYAWPLTEKVIDDIFRKTGNEYLAITRQILDVAPIVNRYFLYNALQNPDVEISWIDDMNGKLLTASPYIQIMKTLGGSVIERVRDKRLTKVHVDEIESAANEISEYALSDNRRHVAKEARMDYALCPMRYLYGYVMAKYPVYQSNFLQNWATNGLIAAVYYLTRDTGISVSEIQDQVLQLFPNLREIEKRQIMDYLRLESESGDPDRGMTSEYADVAYTDERLKIKFPNKDIREIARTKYGELLTPSGRKGINLHEPTEIPGVCMYCQHADYCRNAVFSRDQEDVYD